MSSQSCIGKYGKSLFQIFDLSATTILTLSHYYDLFKSLACSGLGNEGTVESVSGQSCIGYDGTSLFQMLI